jgi:hypothetical protein
MSDIKIPQAHSEYNMPEIRAECAALKKQLESVDGKFWLIENPFYPDETDEIFSRMNQAANEESDVPCFILAENYHVVSSDSEAQETFSTVLMTSLAYSGELRSRNESLDVLKRIYALFKPNEYVSLSSITFNQTGSQYSCVTENTFSASFIVMNQKFAAVFLTYDED